MKRTFNYVYCHRNPAGDGARGDLVRPSAGLGRQPILLAIGGFGQEVREAITARAENLVDQGFARLLGQRIIVQRDLIDTLRRRELEADGARLSAESGLYYTQAADGGEIWGTCRRSLKLISGRFAMIDNGLGFQLVPWSPGLEKRIGQQGSGIARKRGVIEWTFGRKMGVAL